MKNFKLLQVLPLIAAFWSASAGACQYFPGMGIFQCDSPSCPTSSLSGVKLAALSHCNRCNKVSNQLKRCERCKKAHYCDRDCQKLHWSEHKTTCQKKKEELSFDEMLKTLDKTLLERQKHFQTLADSLSDRQKDYFQQLTELDLESILDRGAGEARCKQIGQEAFDYFKSSTQCSFAAFNQLADIVDALQAHSPDGRLRKQYVERAFAGIGDAVKKWQP